MDINLGIAFIIDSVGYDLLLTKISDLQESLLPLVGDVRVIYCGDSCDLERFNKIQSKMLSNLTNDEYVKDIARKKCEDANRMSEQIKLGGSLSEIRKIAGQVIMTIADAVANIIMIIFILGRKNNMRI